MNHVSKIAPSWGLKVALQKADELRKKHTCIDCGKDVRRTWVWVKVEGVDYCGECYSDKFEKGK